MKERGIFLSALEISGSADRESYLKAACGEDLDLRLQVEQLLKAHAEASQFLEKPLAATEVFRSSGMEEDFGDSEEATSPDVVSGEAAFRRYLEPGLRPGSLGRLAHYEIEEILGRGAFGIVARAFDEKLHRVVAIKMMSPELAVTSPPRKRFLREARTAAAVTHENIVAIYAVENEPIPYLVMEYISGQTLQQRMDSHGPLDPDQVLRIGQQIAAGLSAAHSAGLIHRDIKPSNILLSDIPGLRVKISDFGLARAVDDATMTSSGLISGTPMYMAPEQARGETLDHRVDLFALGSVLYHMVSGRPPFRAANTVAVLRRVCEDRPRSVREVIAGTPVWLETIIFRLLEKSRDDRYQSAQEVSDLLVRCQFELEHNSGVTCVVVRSASATERTAEKPNLFSRIKNRRLLFLLPAFFVVMGTSVVFSIWGMSGSGASKEAVELPAVPVKTVTVPANPRKSERVVVSDSQKWSTDEPAPAVIPFDSVQAKAHQERWASHLSLPVEFENSIGMTFRLIPPGEYLMGSSEEQLQPVIGAAVGDSPWEFGIRSEAPPRPVRLIRPVYFSTTELTQEQYDRVMRADESTSNEIQRLSVGKLPTLHVNWLDAAEFCLRLSATEGLSAAYQVEGGAVRLTDGAGYRMPTEAEWEFACRAGSAGFYSGGETEEQLSKTGWYAANSGLELHPVGSKGANPFGICDLHGNAWEWVQDEWGLDRENCRVIKGGHCKNAAFHCRSASRLPAVATDKDNLITIRVVLNVDEVRLTR